MPRLGMLDGEIKAVSSMKVDRMRLILSGQTATDTNAAIPMRMLNVEIKRVVGVDCPVGVHGNE